MTATRGAFVVLVGPDGVGKTSVARSLVDLYDGPTAYFHFRPPLRGRMPEAPPSEAGPQVDKHPGAGPRPLGWARLGRHVIRCWLAHLLTVRPALVRGALVVGDRWSYGYVAQPEALRFAGPRWLAAIAMRLLPRPDLVVNLVASVDSIRSRKAELSESEISHELKAWSQLPVDVLTLPTDRSAPDVVAREVIRWLPGPARYKIFPPGAGHVWVPTSSRRAALAGLSLYAPCRRRGIWLQSAARWAVTLFGPGILPGRSRTFVPPDVEVWRGLQRSWAGLVGPVDGMAMMARRQPSRDGFSVLLLRDGEPVGFARVRRGIDPAADREASALRLLADHPPTSFHVPHLLGAVREGDWGSLVMSVAAEGFHRPGRGAPIGAIVREIQTGLADLAKEPGTPPDWVPMHGDLTPWNLRRLGDGSLVLLDWERVGWGPPGADELLNQASEVALGWRSGVQLDEPDAARFWRDHGNRVISEPSLREALDVDGLARGRHLAGSATERRGVSA